VGRSERSIALVTLDIDHFKQINDEWGHVASERVLVHLARVLTSELRELDVAARLGGEEFAALMPGSDHAFAEAFAERVRAALAAGSGAQLHAVRVSAAVVATTGPTDIQDMLEQVDRTLYAAKRGGRDRKVAIDGCELRLAA
jgi:two-component system, cell cycle response regulator